MAPSFPGEKRKILELSIFLVKTVFSFINSQVGVVVVVKTTVPL
jgi:hypothetical protein